MRRVSPARDEPGYCKQSEGQGNGAELYAKQDRGHTLDTAVESGDALRIGLAHRHTDEREQRVAVGADLKRARRSSTGDLLRARHGIGQLSSGQTLVVALGFLAKAGPIATCPVHKEHSRDDDNSQLKHNADKPHHSHVTRTPIGERHAYQGMGGV